MLDGLETAVKDGDTVVILPAMAGGASQVASSAPGRGPGTFRPLLLGVVEDVGGLALLDDHAAVHEHDLVADLFGEAHLVGDDEHRHPFRGELAHRVEHLFDELGVEGAGDLVEQHHVRFHRQRPGDRDPLLLAAGEPFGVLAELVAEADPFEQRGRFLPRLRLRAAEHLFRRHRHVLERGLVGEEVELLEDHPDPLADEVEVPALLAGARAGPLQMSWPSRKISPCSGGSSRLTQRSSVLLPEPLGPRMQTTSPLATSRSIPFSTSSSPKRLWMPCSLSIGSRPS